MRYQIAFRDLRADRACTGRYEGDFTLGAFLGYVHDKERSVLARFAWAYSFQAQ